ncbi:F-box protein SKIP31-like protein [Drosera capensis]
MVELDDEDENLAHFLESEMLSEVSDEEEELTETEERPGKRYRGEDVRVDVEIKSEMVEAYVGGKGVAWDLKGGGGDTVMDVRGIDSGVMRIPAELFRHILKFLSSEDLISCLLVCKFMNHVASDESLWKRLYCMRWGLLPPTKKMRECPWKKLYIQRDEQDMIGFVRNCQPEFREYYIQMNAAKRSQVPLPSQVVDDGTLLDKTVADRISMWKSGKGFTDKVAADHACSRETCSYYQIDDVFVCEQTGKVHVCDDACREAMLDPTSQLFVCTISGHCFDWLLLPAEAESDNEQQQSGVGDEAEPFMGSGRFARAYLLGYNCSDDKELEDTLKFC